MSASPVLFVPCLPSCVSLSGGVRLSGLVCALPPFICLPSCVSLSGGVRLFGLVCPFFLHLSPFICLPLRVSLGGGVRLCGLVCALSPFICLFSHISLSGGIRLSGFVCALSPFICLPSYVSLSAVSASPVLLLRLSPIVSPFVCLCLDGMTHCLPLSSLHMCLVGFPRSCLRLSLVVSPQARLSWMVCPLSRGLVSHGLPSYIPLLDGMPAFPSCLPLFPMPPTASKCLSLFPHMRVRLPKVLSSLVSLFVSLCWMVRLPPLLWIISHCPPFCFPLLDGKPSRGLVPLVSQLVSQFARLFFLLVPFGVRFPACFPCYFRFLDGARVFPRPCLPACFPACLPVGLCSCFRLLDGASAFPRLCLSFP